jgi:4-diphosphocytidyl-2-C-methyl-D-erythritol kinase
MSRTLVLRPSAKINLTLRVGDRRPDGFHEVRTLLQTIALSDRLTLSYRPGPFALVSTAPGVPADRSNLVFRAAERLWREMGREGDPRDAHVRLVKQIPVAAGLGGGSADAAAALVGLNALWNARLRPRDLMRLGGELGSDVPFMLHGGTALAAGRGEELYPVDDLPRLAVVVVKPSFGVHAGDAYRWLDEDRGVSEQARLAAPQRPAHLEVGWPAGSLALVNDLQAPVTARHPVVAEMLDSLARAGARAWAMTGSGSAAFGVFAGHVPEAVPRRLQRPDWQVLVTRTCDRREAVRRLGL